ncbi:hypothetical protein ZOSMA_10G00700 [Zostera marina]|uniref:Uncharacterized protein n=1 Tax=Zostera marina TaxID=29655 RepID=A0A0K9Q5K7_ZOSMR|nr:hypothetical protein ZOSMA_10G00700 [Zostera marina]
MALDLLRVSSLSSMVVSSAYASSSRGRSNTGGQISKDLGRRSNQNSVHSERSHFPNYGLFTIVKSKPTLSEIPRSADSSSPNTSLEDQNDPSSKKSAKVPFGYTRKDVLLIGLGVTALGIGLESGLEFAGFDSLKAGNVVQLVLVLGLTIGWISTYIFRVGNKDMTYVKQLKDYENKVMEKRMDGLTEVELNALLEQVDEEKERLASNGRSDS